MTEKELEIILAEGESYTIEFKESVDKSIVEEACAFANSSGGRIFIGVSDDGKVKGVDMSNVVRSRIQDTLRQIQPELNIKIDIFQNVIILIITEGKDKPYSCSRGFFLRVGPNSQKLGRNEIISFIQSEGRIRFDEFVKNDAMVNENLNREAYSRFLRLSRISNVLPEVPMLQNLGCAVKSDGKSLFTNAGILFFSKDCNAGSGSF